MKAGSTAKTRPPSRHAQKPWSGRPSCGRTVGYLPSGTVGQWYPVTGQRWTGHKGGDPKTDQARKGADSELPGWQPAEKVPQPPRQKKEVLSEQRGWRSTARKGEEAQRPRCVKGGDPRTPRSVLSRTQTAGRLDAAQSRSLHGYVHARLCWTRWPRAGHGWLPASGARQP